jgi:hypothetical protein
MLNIFLGIDLAICFLYHFYLFKVTRIKEESIYEKYSLKTSNDCNNVIAITK